MLTKITSTHYLMVTKISILCSTTKSPNTFLYITIGNHAIIIPNVNQQLNTINQISRIVGKLKLPNNTADLDNSKYIFQAIITTS